MYIIVEGAVSDDEPEIKTEAFFADFMPAVFFLKCDEWGQGLRSAQLFRKARSPYNVKVPLNPDRTSIPKISQTRVMFGVDIFVRHDLIYGPIGGLYLN